MMKPLSRKKRQIYLGALVVIFLGAIPLLMLYATGYRINSAFAVFKTGGILVQNQLSGTDILLNGKLVKTTNLFQRSIFLDNLKPGVYSIEAQKDGYQSWKQKLAVLPEQVSQTAVFILPKQVEINEVTSFIISTSTVTTSESGTTTSVEKVKTFKSSNPDYAKVKMIFENPLLASTTRIFQKVHIGYTKNELLVKWAGLSEDTPQNLCSIERCFIESKFPISGIRDLDFYPGRSDVVVVSGGSDIYAKQIDARDAPPLQKIYHGTAPSFRLDSEVIYIRDQGHYFKIEL